MKSRKPEPAVIEYKNMRFLITDRPTDTNIDRYIEVTSSLFQPLSSPQHNSIEICATCIGSFTTVLFVWNTVITAVQCYWLGLCWDLEAFSLPPPWYSHMFPLSFVTKVNMYVNQTFLPSTPYHAELPYGVSDLLTQFVSLFTLDCALVFWLTLW